MKPVVERMRNLEDESPPTRGAWIETRRVTGISQQLRSPPTRGAWIETQGCTGATTAAGVAPHAGGVD